MCMMTWEALNTSSGFTDRKVIPATDDVTDFVLCFRNPTGWTVVNIG